MTSAAPAAERRPAPQPGRTTSRLLTGVLVLPAFLWYVVLLVMPIAIVVLFSFGDRTRTGGYAPGFTLDNYIAALQKPDPFLTSLMLSVLGTVLCLLVGLPLAYFIATRATKRKALLIVLLVIPFWTSFLIRTYAWLLILGVDGVAGFVQDLTGNRAFRVLGTEPGVLLGLVYGYLPLMVFPLYVTLERMDRSLVEASKDLGAGRWATFRQVTLPIALPGLITGSILVFIPMMGEYVIPTIIGYGQVFTIGNALFLRFLEARNWPAGAALSVGLIIVMLVVVTGYVWFTNRGRKSRDVSVI
ncbi:MAG TPA: ABC transporter permease [Candidatus Limnocylindrales bacterium]|nr:ABC transporter permease [Candidatus Limnocylindrales bacterium]